MSDETKVHEASADGEEAAGVGRFDEANRTTERGDPELRWESTREDRTMTDRQPPVYR